MQAPSAGLRCLQGSAGWAGLIAYDRPAVLALAAENGATVPVLLRQTSGLQAEVEVDGRPLSVPVDELERYWTGDFALLWRTPPGGSATLQVGDRGDDVKWLRDQLQRVTGLASIEPDPRRFGTALQQLLRNFQNSQNLAADGIAGPRTLIYLNNLTGDPPAPRLRTGAGG
jgi:general secretion pathway protein A